MSIVAVAALVATQTASLLAQEESSGELKNVAVVAGASWNRLTADVAYIGGLAGRPEMGQMLEGTASFFTQGKGPNAIDKAQPWGIIVQTDGAQFLPVGCLPVTKPEDLFDVARGYGAEVKDGEGGVKELSFASGKSYFVKLQDGMAFVATSSESLARVPASAQKILANLLEVGDYDIAAHVSVRNVPEMYREFAVNAMQAGMQQQMKQKEGESDEAYAQREKLAEAQLEQMKQMINEIDNVRFGIAADSKGQRAYADFIYAFVPGGKLAKQMSGYGAPKSNFAGFFQPNAAATGSVATQVDRNLIADDMAQMDAQIASGKEQLNAELDKQIDDEEIRDAVKAAVSDWIDVAGETLKSGKIDAAAALNLSPDSISYLFGAHVENPAKVEAGLQNLDKAAKKSDKLSDIKWNADSHSGVNIHTFTVQTPDDKLTRELIGSEATVAVGLGPKEVYVAVGKADSVAAMKKAIDASRATPNKSVKPVEFSVALGPIMEMAAAHPDNERQKAIVEPIANLLKSEAAGRDHIRIVGEFLPNGVKYHFEAEEGVLKAIGKAAAAAQQQRAAARGQ
jgi:hypothetical protein